MVESLKSVDTGSKFFGVIKKGELLMGMIYQFP